MDDLHVWAVLLRDSRVHLARPGHVNCLCGAHRLSNADTVNAQPTCSACLEAFQQQTGAEPQLLTA